MNALNRRAHIDVILIYTVGHSFLPAQYPTSRLHGHRYSIVTKIEVLDSRENRPMQDCGSYNINRSSSVVKDSSQLL